MMRVSSREIRGVVLDMDGVLVDSEPFLHEALNTVLGANDRAPLSFDGYARYVGASDEFIWDDLVCRLRLQQSVEFYRDQYDTCVIDLYRQRSTITSGTTRLLDALSAEGIPLAVASSSRRSWVDTCLQSLGIRAYFEVVVDGEMVDLPKPDPAIYHLAARHLRVAPDECMAVEDAPRGITAAVTAGMLTAAVDTPYTRPHDTGAAHLRVQSLDDLVERVASFVTRV